MQLEAIVLRKCGQSQRITFFWDQTVAIGYSGRNQKSIIAHVEELKELGVPSPSTIPSMYWIDPTRISSDEYIFVIGDGCSGEVEFFAAFDAQGDMYFTIASDHTDRKLETISVSKSKQGCSKIIGNLFWSFDEVKDHWDEIKLHSWVRSSSNMDWRLYQDGTLGMLLISEELLKLAKEDAPIKGAISYFSGTIPLLGEISYHGEFKMELYDPVLNRSIKHSYRVIELPDRN